MYYFLLGIYVSFEKIFISITEGNNTEVEIVLDYAAGTNFSLMLKAIPLTAKGKQKQHIMDLF